MKKTFIIKNKSPISFEFKSNCVHLSPALMYWDCLLFCLDDSGNIWIGTIGNGLIKFDTNTSHFISLKNVLQQDIYSIYSICYDNGNVWMGTDNGLFCYNIADNQLMRFDKRENTQGQVYYPLASMKGRDGLLYFGGTNGFTVINPKINMPVMDGFEVLKAMNANHTIEDIPVIMISSDDSDAAIRKSYELGASDYVNRPFDARIVYRRVTNTIKLYAKQRRLVQMVSDQIRARENNTDMLVGGCRSHIVEFRNGESGAHVRHIRIITEMLLHRLLEI